MKDMISEELLKEAIAVYMQKNGEIILRKMEEKNNGKDKDVYKRQVYLSSPYRYHVEGTVTFTWDAP